MISLKTKQTTAIKQMLNFNDFDSKTNIASSSAIFGDEWSDQWKVLVLDDFCMDVLSPLLTVSDLRKLGVTLHMNVKDSREAIPDVPAIYFLLPTPENIKLIGLDFKKPLYPEFYFNFASMISRSHLESLAAAAVTSSASKLVKKVFDQYMNFVALEDRLFSLNISDSFYAYNNPKSTEGIITNFIDSLVEGLFAVFATIGVIPIIRAKAGTAAEMAARKLNKKLKDYLASGSTLFQSDTSNISGSNFSRPLLVLMDRDIDYVTMLHHTSTYQSLVHDLLKFKNNSVTVNATSSSSSTSSSFSGQKTYHLDSNTDEFWKNYAGVSFPEAIRNNDLELQAVTAKENAIRDRTGADKGDIDDITSGVKNLLAVTDSLPELLEQKKFLEAHTTILRAAMNEIAKREIPSLYEIEDQMVQSGVADEKVLESVIHDAKKGNLHDKLRLLCIALLATDISTIESYESDMKKLAEVSSTENAEFSLGALQWLKKHCAFDSRPKMGPSAATDTSSSTSTAINMGFNIASGLLAKATASVKTYLPGSNHLPATSVVSTLMSNSQRTSNNNNNNSNNNNNNNNIASRGDIADQYLYFDPKFRGVGSSESVPRQTAPFKEAVVFMIGGGCYTEYQNLQDYASKSKTPMQIIYGCSELLNPIQFLKQLNRLQEA